MSFWSAAAISNALSDPAISEKQATVASSIQTKARLTKDYRLKLLFCKKCKEFSPPISSTRIRIRHKVLTIYCSRCGQVYRHPLKNKATNFKIATASRG